MQPEPLIHVFHAGVAHTLVRATQSSLSRFGGPLQDEVVGRPFGPRGLHAIAELAGEHVPTLEGVRRSLRLPLVFGLCFDACRIEYEHELHRVRVLALEPDRSSDDWPYRDYPPHLPFAPLALGSSARCAWSEFAARFGHGATREPAELVAIVPPPMTLGVSLWGREGDAEGVRIVFECELEARRVRASTLAS